MISWSTILSTSRVSSILTESRPWVMGKIDRSELLEYFLAEAEDYLNVLSHGIPELAVTTDRNTLLEELFRAAHTLKGAASIRKADCNEPNCPFDGGHP